MTDPWNGVACIGFVAVVLAPALLLASVGVRALIIAWQPRELAERLVEPDGSAPRLAGWVGVIWLGTFALAWSVFQAAWLLAAWTTFKPLTVGFAMPIAIVGTVLIAVVASAPVARLLTAVAREIDRRWRGETRRTILRPRWIFGGAIGTAAIVAGLAWPAVDVATLVAVIAGLGLAVTVHLVWRRERAARRIASAVIVPAAVAAIAIALVFSQARATRTLEVWGDGELSRFAIERAFELERIHARIPAAALRLPELPGQPHRDIVLVTIGSMRADHTPVYGGLAEMPALRTLGDRGAVFHWAFTSSTAIEGSLPAVHLGIAPARIRPQPANARRALDPRHITVAERLHAAGYETAGFVCCGSVAGMTSLERGFDVMTRSTTGDELKTSVAAWLDQHAAATQRRPMLLWVHLSEPRDWQRRIDRSLSEADRRPYYDRALSDADAMIGSVLAAFSSRPPDRAPVIVLTADRGEGLGDHDQPLAASNVYNGIARVPLIIAGPGVKVQRIYGVVSLTDVAPTLLELAGFVPPRRPAPDGRSLVDAIRGARPLPTDRGIAFVDGSSGRKGTMAVIKGRWKLIEAGATSELYDLHNDPEERANVVTVRVKLAEELRRMIVEYKAAAGSPF
ncbi:MAG: sulfatase-like hydrolase/transferase [Kofleriaceae bacterium]